MWWNKWTGDQAIRGLKRFWLLNTYLAISGKNWLKTDLNHFWIKIYLWTELEGNPSDWMAFSIFVLAFFFSPFHVFSFLLSRFFIIYLVAVCRQEKIKRSHCPKEKMFVFGAGFLCHPLYFCLIVAARGLCDFCPINAPLMQNDASCLSHLLIHWFQYCWRQKELRKVSIGIRT